MPNKEAISSQNDMERLEIREQTKSKSEAKWKYKVRLCVCRCVQVCGAALWGAVFFEKGVWGGVHGLGGMSGGVFPPGPRAGSEGVGVSVASVGPSSRGIGCLLAEGAKCITV